MFYMYIYIFLPLLPSHVHVHSPIHTNPYIHAHKAHTHKTTIRTGTPLLMTHNTLLSALVYSCSGSRGISSVRSVFDAANTIGLIRFFYRRKRGDLGVAFVCLQHRISDFVTVPLLVSLFCISLSLPYPFFSVLFSLLSVCLYLSLYFTLSLSP